MKNTNLNKTIFAAVLTAGISTSANATIESGTVDFKVLPLIEITQVIPMAFGQVVKLNAGKTCTLTVNSTNTLATGAEQASSIAAAGTPEALGGDCAPDGLVTPKAGVYDVKSQGGGVVTVILKDFSDANITFVPAGYTVNYLPTPAYINLTNAATGTEINVPDNADQLADPLVTPGTNRLIIGGTFTNTIKLAPNTDLLAKLEISVNY